MTKPSHLEVEKELLEKFKEFLGKKIGQLKSPSCIYFTSWTFTQPEGKLIEAWKTQGENIERDDERKQLGTIWSFIFPEFREDYLVERTWNWMQKQEKCEHSMLIHPLNSLNPLAENDLIWTVCLKEDFKELLSGDSLEEKIRTQYQQLKTRYKDIDEIDLCLKTARLLRYNEDFNKTQIEGINKAFSFWVNKKGKITDDLNSLFKELYEKDDPVFNSLEARKFLTIWQNFSVLFPSFPYIFLYFSIPSLKDNPAFRYAVALCYKTFDGNNLRPVSRNLKQMMTEIHSKFQEQYLKYLTRYSNNLEPQKTPRNKDIGDFRWLKVKEEQFRDIVGVIGKDKWKNFNRLDRLVELAERLSFSTHESRPCRFAFIAGTEQIWPAVEEIISLEKYREFDLELFVKQCEANYSIFQVGNVVGFFNTDLQSIYKIVRLRTPTKDELRQTGDHINDLDDLFCWAIEKIYEETGLISFLVCTHGDGRILFYGLSNSSKKADLLFIWDVRTGKLKIPIEKPKEIKNALMMIGINEDDVRYRNIIKTIRKISACPGEGAALIIARNPSDIEKYVVTMEPLMPPWLRALGLDDPQYLLRAAFVLDGACLITPERVKPRLAIYPHYTEDNQCRAFGYLEYLQNKTKLSKEQRKERDDLCGKGSKTHVARNLTAIPGLQGNCIVITISADGPVRIWK